MEFPSKNSTLDANNPQIIVTLIPLIFLAGVVCRWNFPPRRSNPQTKNQNGHRKVQPEPFFKSQPWKRSSCPPTLIYLMSTALAKTPFPSSCLSSWSWGRQPSLFNQFAFCLHVDCCICVWCLYGDELVIVYKIYFAAIKHQPHVYKKLKSKAPTTCRFKNPEFKPQTPSLSRPKWRQSYRLFSTWSVKSTRIMTAASFRPFPPKRLQSTQILQANTGRRMLWATSPDSKYVLPLIMQPNFSHTLCSARTV